MNLSIDQLTKTKIEKLIEEISGNNYSKIKLNELNIDKAVIAYAEFMQALGLDLTDDNLKDTPFRVTQSFINDLFSGLYKDEPKITVFDNQDGYDQMICQTGIDVVSICSHHFLPFIGKAAVAYIPIPDGKIIGLSKLNRIVQYFARRPQVQENLTQQIHDYLNKRLENSLGIAVYIEAKHTCVNLRGVKDPNSIMKTTKLSGAFKENHSTRDEFYRMISF